MKNTPNEKPTTTAAELIDVKAVAKLLSCSARHVYRLVDAGKMPAPVKLGVLVRWRSAELANWLDAGCPTVSEWARQCP